MLDNGADIRFVQEMLGHVSIETTEIYTHVSIVKLQQIHRLTHPSTCETPENSASGVTTDEVLSVLESELAEEMPVS